MKKKNVLTFLHMPKTAGSTVNYILRRSFGTRHVDVIPKSGHTSKVVSDDLILVDKIYRRGGVKSLAGHGFRMDTDFGSSPFSPDFFTMIRNPVSRSLSLYQYRTAVRKKEKVEPLTFFAKKGIQNFQTKRFAGDSNLQKAIDTIEEKVRFVGLVERFDESLIRLKKSVPEYALDVHYRRKNTAVNSLFKDELKSDQQVMSLLTESNQVDIELCKYVEERFFSENMDMPDDRLEITSPLPSLRVLTNRLKRNAIYKPAVQGNSGK